MDSCVVTSLASNNRRLRGKAMLFGAAVSKPSFSSRPQRSGIIARIHCICAMDPNGFQSRLVIHACKSGCISWTVTSSLTQSLTLGGGCTARVTVVGFVCVRVCLSVCVCVRACVRLLSQISPSEHLFVLKSILCTQRATKVKKFVWFPLKLLRCWDPALPLLYGYMYRWPFFTHVHYEHAHTSPYAPRVCTIVSTVIMVDVWLPCWRWNHDVFTEFLKNEGFIVVTRDHVCL